MNRQQLENSIEELTQNLFTITNDIQIKRVEKAIRCYLLQLSKAN